MPTGTLLCRPSPPVCRGPLCPSAERWRPRCAVGGQAPGRLGLWAPPRPRVPQGLGPLPASFHNVLRTGLLCTSLLIWWPRAMQRRPPRVRRRDLRPGQLDRDPHTHPQLPSALGCFSKRRPPDPPGPAGAASLTCWLLLAYPAGQRSRGSPKPGDRPLPPRSAPHVAEGVARGAQERFRWCPGSHVP